MGGQGRAKRIQERRKYLAVKCAQLQMPATVNRTVCAMERWLKENA